MIVVTIGEMVGSDQVPDRQITGEPFELVMANVFQLERNGAFLRQQRSAPKRQLTPPTLLESLVIVLGGRLRVESPCANARCPRAQGNRSPYTRQIIGRSAGHRLI